jgi:hypothetical protein
MLEMIAECYMKRFLKGLMFFTLGITGMIIGFLWGYLKTGYGAGLEAFYDWER